jgi:hypothetical protein
MKAENKTKTDEPQSRSTAGLGGGTDDDCEYDDEEWACTHCGGEGYREVDDPMWDDCDEFGYGTCHSCRGTGLRKHQTVF